ncbi:hypothetical protein VW23_016745 [Devosia insulae DS-56]|uniref:DUF305 domain-containing protein n=1 Tax=Devosia insulae DS-56 TaxID=1116389 RepID=A0A1E5XRU3_9HYPH|nr:DUF305 domain-containing protein [Devosia insulae]OEO31332.1 hypothetical protein VW23_016745 [Devosia insulae DS-56]
MHKFTLAAALLLASAFPALAQQDHGGHGAAPATTLPAICLANAPQAAAPMAMPHGAGASEAHTELMAGMDAMNADMMAGGTATDIDVAFVCSMIPHHRGAIDMAKAELKHGDDPWAREMAQAVITAQEKEIADMLAWLEKQPQ